MGWELHEIDDQVTEALLPLRGDDEWIAAFEDLELYEKMESTLEITEDSWPILLTYTEDLPAPLCCILRGEAHSDDYLGGAMDVGFNSAAMVRKIGAAMSLTSDSALLDMLMQSSKVHNWPVPGIDSCEWDFVPHLRAFYVEAARAGKAVLVMMNH